MKTSGFTLLELLITLAIIAIVMGIAVPSMSTFVENDRLITQINTLTSHLNYARSEAVLRHVQIGVCSSNNTTTCNGGANWEDGWLVFVDADGDSSYTVGEQVLKVQQNLEGSTTTLTTSIANTVIFDTRGFAPNMAGTFSICDHRGVSELISISLSNTGRVRKDGAAVC